MKTSSPLRYPGGKSAMSALIADIRRLNQMGHRTIVEPFAGGAGASLTLLFREESRAIHINDADPAIHDFWWCLVNRPDQFLDKLRSTRVSMAEWRRQRAVYRSTGRVSRLARGFAAFYLNRCNRSGIIMNGGPIGGVKQEGRWKLGARYNKPGLVERCQRVAEYRDRIKVSSLDGLKLMESIPVATSFLIIDPPYFEKGPTLYLNGLASAYHKALAERLRSRTDDGWILTYDDCAEIRALYSEWANVRPYHLRYTAATRRTGRELLITPRGMTLPQDQTSLTMSWS